MLPTLHMTSPFCRLNPAELHEVPPHTAAAVIGAGYSLGTVHSGTENGPYFLRNLSKAYTWAAEDPEVMELRHGRVPLERAVDLGDIDFSGMTLDEAQKSIRGVVAALPDNVAPCVIGGDHSITLAVLEGLRSRRSDSFTVVQFDQHLDLQIWDGAPGRPDIGREPLFNTNVMSHVSDLVGPGRLVQVGVNPYATVERGAAPGMDSLLRSVGMQVCVFSPEIDDAQGFLDVIGPADDVYITVDIDVLDSSVMSSTGYPAGVGLGMRELVRLIDLVLTRHRIIGFDLVEFSAPRDARDPRTLGDAGRAALLFLHLLSRACRPAAAGTKGDRGV
ncbi:arginase family protein [Streptomyces sp. NBC_01190]|uniref:arginase family protein n=1 Tax=Streptomyces sp. NBC_01190 TaxID=2903767 RepID=UPI0038663F74|nr:arginase family protein [Streptomyces sp. NBC_01190]